MRPVQFTFQEFGVTRSSYALPDIGKLLLLAKFLRELSVAKTQFSMDLWVSSPARRRDKKQEGSCGFAGCAMGWAAHAKLFAGLRLEYYRRGKEYGLVYRDDDGDEHYGFSAAQELFFLPDQDADQLFDKYYYPKSVTPTMVAKRVETLVAGELKRRGLALENLG